MFTRRKFQSVNIGDDIVELEEKLVGETSLNNVTKVDVMLAEVGIVMGFQMDSETSDSVSEYRKLRRSVGFG